VEDRSPPVEQTAPRVPVGTVTFLFTDIEGSTKLVAQLRNDYGGLQADHQRLLREAFAAWEGREVDTQGDAFFVAFRRARDGVSAAVAAQRALEAHEWPAGTEVRVRMGIHTDEPGVSADRYHGLGVVRAARICAAGHGGQILLSAATRSLIDEDELPGVEIRDLGEHRLKDLPRPEHIFQFIAPGLRDEFPPLKTVEGGGPTVSGREAELADAAREALEPRPRRALTRRWPLVAAVGIAAAVAAVLYVIMGSSGQSPVIAPPNSLAVIDPVKNRVVRAVAVGDTPTAVADGAGAVWVLNANAGTVSEIDPQKRTVLATFPAGAAPTDLTVGSGAVWVATSSFTLLQIDPGTKIPRGIRLPQTTNPAQQGHSSWVAASGSDVWATGNSTALRVSPSRLAVRFRSSTCCNGIAIGGGSVWLADQTGLRELDAETGHTVLHVRLGFGSGEVAYGKPYVWVAEPIANRVWAIDPRTGTVAGSVTVGAQPDGIAVGDGAVWVSSADGTVSRIDPVHLRVVEQIRVGGTPAGIAVGDGAVWVTVD